MTIQNIATTRLDSAKTRAGELRARFRQKSAEAHDARREAEAWKIISIAWEERYRSLMKAIRAIA